MVLREIPYLLIISDMTSLVICVIKLKSSKTKDLNSITDQAIKIGALQIIRNKSSVIQRLKYDIFLVSVAQFLRSFLLL